MGLLIVPHGKRIMEKIETNNGVTNRVVISKDKIARRIKQERKQQDEDVKE